MGARLIAVALGALVALGAARVAGAAEAPSAEARVQMAPTGRLRVAFIRSIPTLVSRDPATGALAGVAPALGRALAEQLRVPLVPLDYASERTYAESLGAGLWDIAFMPREPQRANAVDFSAAFMLVDYGFLAAPGRRFGAAAELDRPNLLIAVARESAAEAFLARTLKEARLYRVDPGLGPAIEILRSRDVAAYAGTDQFLASLAPSVPGASAVEGSFNTIAMAVGISRGRPAALAYVNAFLREAKSSGLLQQMIAQAGLHGVHIAP